MFYNSKLVKSLKFKNNWRVTADVFGKKKFI